MTPTNSYASRPVAYSGVDRETWTNWKWQQQSAVRTVKKLQEVFPNISSQQVSCAQEWERRGFRYALTPYILSLVGVDQDGRPVPTDPVWRQFFPEFPELLIQVGKPAYDEYVPDKDNWEVPEEMVTPIMHWKYDNRAILYTADSCLAYCGYCLRSLQSTSPEERHGTAWPHWDVTLAAISAHPQIEEVILSGGDPLTYDNRSVRKMLADIRAIPTVKAIRIHTRAFTHNPYRLDAEFCDLLREYQVTEMAVHTTHPNELSEDFQECIERIRKSGARTLLLGQLPLIKGVNDDAELLHQHFMELYVSGVKPYYLLHCMPNIPAASTQRTSVRRGAELMTALKRHISNPALPEYVIAHRTGKRTVPQEPEGTEEFQYTSNAQGQPIVRFKDWKGVWQEYLDGRD